MRIGIVAIALGMLAGCTQSEAVVHHASASFTAEQQEDMRRGAAFIDAHTGRATELVFDLPDGAPCERWNILRTDGNGGVMSPGGAGCIVIGTANQRSREQFQALVAHELGHFAGLGHVGDERSLMYHELPKLAWTEADEKECVRVECTE